MARTLSAPLLAAITGGTCYPAMLVAVEWASGTTRFWSGVESRTFLGETFTGAGNLLTISSVQETVDLRANGLTLTLSGVNNAVLAAALSERRQGKPASLWIVFLDADGAELDDPYLLFGGSVDVPKIRLGPETSTVSIQCESPLVDFQRPRRSRYTPEDQKARYADDRGFEHVPRIQNLRLTWGSQPIQGGAAFGAPPAPAGPNSGGLFYE